MSTRPHAATDFPTPVEHQVTSPDRYADWRSYAFSDAPELSDDLDAASAPDSSV